MKFSLLKIRIHHIFILSLLLLTAEATVSTVYNYFSIRDASLKTAETLVHYVLRARLAVLYTSDQPPSVFQQRFLVLQSSFANAPHVDLYLKKSTTPNTIELPENTLLPTLPQLTQLISILFKTHELSVTTYISNQKTWITFAAHYSTMAYWEDAATYLLYNILVICILWFSFFLYCRYTLPSEVLGNIAAHNPEEKSSSRIIQKLQQQVQNYLDEKNLMLGALAHDIKTPLTEALLRLELLHDQNAAESIKNSLNKINRIVTSSLEYAKQSHRIKTIQVDVVSLMELLIENYTESGFDVSFNSNVEQCDIAIELELFKRMVINLLENARKYATHCQVTLEKMEEQLRLIFEDNGSGVPDKFLKLLGIPYFRIDQSRSSNTGGSGLGLAIVKKIVELHHGEITFNNIEHGGFQAMITLDLKKLQPDDATHS